MASTQGTAVVTGASAGIGEEFARRLADLGYDVVAVARRGERLNALAAEARAAGAGRITPLVADLTDRADLARVEGVITNTADLAMLVNNAGAAGYGPFAELPPDQAENLIDLHITATTRLTRAALPGMMARGRGDIVNVSSGLAFSASVPAPPLPYRAVYASAKSYINTFSEIVANEVAGTGVRVQALCPGGVRTEFHAVAGVDTSRIQNMLTVEQVVTASLKGLELGEVVCVIALEDPALVGELAAVRGRILEQVRTGVPAKRLSDG